MESGEGSECESLEFWLDACTHPSNGQAATRSACAIKMFNQYKAGVSPEELIKAIAVPVGTRLLAMLAWVSAFLVAAIA
ncbi:hypothetical protein J2S97_003464 [Arthrobacter oryzae]|nr:hypothetical protein [Arthrobacter oryzae]